MQCSVFFTISFTFFVYFCFHPVDRFFKTNKFIFDRNFEAIYKQSHIKLSHIKPPLFTHFPVTSQLMAQLGNDKN